MANAKNGDALKPDVNLKKTSFQPLNDAQDEIKLSKSLLHINRTTKNIFLKMIILLLKMYEEFKEPGFCKKKFT